MAQATEPKVAPQTNIHRTTDYGQFKFLLANREQNRGHIETLKTAFEEIGNLTRVQPILVNDNFEIIDGQHRFIACKELDLPIYYTVVPGLGVPEARSMNILHRNWDNNDYAKSYAETGNTNYKIYLKLRQDYEYNHSITMAAVYGGAKGGFKDFREGNFFIEDEQLIRERLDFLKAVEEVLPIGLDREVARALIAFTKKDTFDKERMIKKIILHPDAVTRQASITDTMRMLEDVYNFKVHDENRVRLF